MHTVYNVPTFLLHSVVYFFLLYVCISMIARCLMWTIAAMHYNKNILFLLKWCCCSVEKFSTIMHTCNQGQNKSTFLSNITTKRRQYVKPTNELCYKFQCKLVFSSVCVFIHTVHIGASTEILIITKVKQN